LIFKKTSSVPASTAAGSTVLVESSGIIEIKPGHLSTGRTVDFSHDYSKFCTTAFLATEQQQCSPKLSCNGLLLSISGEIVLFTLKIKMGEIAQLPM